MNPPVVGLKSVLPGAGCGEPAGSVPPAAPFGEVDTEALPVAELLDVVTPLTQLIVADADPLVMTVLLTLPLQLVDDCAVAVAQHTANASSEVIFRI